MPPRAAIRVNTPLLSPERWREWYKPTLDEMELNPAIAPEWTSNYRANVEDMERELIEAAENPCSECGEEPSTQMCMVVDAETKETLSHRFCCDQCAEVV